MNNFHKIVLASAGTGKTYSLVENYLHAVLGLNLNEPKKPHEILALTFTDKAAEEMRLRIAQRLTNLLFSNDPIKDVFNEKEIKSLDAAELKKIIRGLSSSQICTFHSFAANFLRQYGKKFFINHDFAILSPFKESIIAKNILGFLLIEQIKEQNSIIKNLCARYKLENSFLAEGLIESIWKVYNSILEKTYDFSSFHAPQGKNIIFENFDLLKKSIINAHSAQLTPTAKARLKDVNENFLSFEQALDSLKENLVATKFLHLKNSLKGNFAGSVRTSIVDELEKTGVSLYEYFIQDDEFEIVKILQLFHNKFSNYKKDNNFFSYADLLINTVQILKNDFEIKEEINKRFKHIMVDEYQDTSPIQQDLVLLLSSKNSFCSQDDIMSKSIMDDQKSLFIVGDKKQSIYGFRGAQSSLFDSMLKKLQENEKNFLFDVLNINRRSDKNILAFVNLVASHTLKEQGYSEKENLIANTENCGDIAIWTVENDANFSTITAQGIKNLIDDKNAIAQDITILVRRIKSAQFIKEELKNLGINSIIVGGEGFFQRQEIVDLIHALKLMIDKTCSLSFAVVLRSPLILLSDNDILAIKIFLDENNRNDFSLANVENLIDTIPISNESKNKIKNFTNIINDAKNILGEKNLGYVLNLLLTKTKFLAFYALGDQKEQVLANIEKFHAMLISSYENPWNLVHDLEKQIKENKREPLAKSNAHENAVQIMTIHQSKGLEFKTLVVTDMESTPPVCKDNILFDEDLKIAIKAKNRLCKNFIIDRSEPKFFHKFSKIIQKRSSQEAHEQARLLYVALTRAKHNLYFAITKKSLEKKTSSKTLCNLLLSAKEAKKTEFEQLCPTKVLEENKNDIHQKNNEQIQTSYKKYCHKTLMKRFFSSSLKAENTASIELPLVQPHDLKINGSIAHQIIAKTAENLFDLKAHISADLIFELINASVRQLSDKVNKDTITASFITINALAPILKQAQEIYCEMHLLTKPNEFILVEGFADMVINTKEKLYVLDFKSFHEHMTSLNTLMQVVSYAHALEAIFHKPIFFAPCYIGSPEPIAWHFYDTHYKNFFMENVLKQELFPLTS